MQPGVEISGEVLYTLPDDDPLYRVLSVGDEGVDAATVERALAAAGYEPGEVDGIFTEETAEEIRAWEADVEIEETGGIDPSRQQHIGRVARGQ